MSQIKKIDHLGVMVSNLDEAVKFYTEVLGFGEGDGRVFEREFYGKVKFRFLPIGDVKVSLHVAADGPWTSFGSASPGDIIEISFEVEDMDKFYDEMKEKGITLIGRDGSPLTPDKRYEVADSGLKFAWLPRDKTFGTWIEVVEPIKK